jgi:hypothetical protein
MGYESIDNDQKKTFISEKWLVHMVLISVQLW